MPGFGRITMTYTIDKANAIMRLRRELCPRGYLQQLLSFSPQKYYSVIPITKFRDEGHLPY